MDWIIANWQGILNVIVAIVAAAKVGAKLTPSEMDDTRVGQAVKLLDIIGMVGNKTTIKYTKKF